VLYNFTKIKRRAVDPEQFYPTLHCSYCECELSKPVIIIIRVRPNKNVSGSCDMSQNIGRVGRNFFFLLFTDAEKGVI